jgi:peptide deformylase
MAVRPILRYGDPLLVAENAPVERFDKELETLIADLFETGWQAPGLGLAAPQVGVNLRLAVVDLSVGEDPEEKLVLANPEIVDSDGSCSVEEGCLSFPGMFTNIARPRRIKVAAQDSRGEPQELEAEGLLAQAICHEVDHLNATLLVDHLRGLKRRMFLKRIKKLQNLDAWSQ